MLVQVTPLTNQEDIVICEQPMCMLECGLCGHTGPSVLQLDQLNEISDSNINSSGTLMRTMRGNCLTKEGIMVLVWDRAALFTKVIGQRVFETVHHIKSVLCYSQFCCPQGSSLDFFVSLIFHNRAKRKIYLWRLHCWF